MKIRVWTAEALALSVVLSVPALAGPEGDSSAAIVPPDARRQAQEAIDRGLAYLRSTQDPAGGWTPKYGPAITAIVGQAFAQDARHGPKSPIVQKAVARVLDARQKDGGIYTPGMNLENYQTAVALMFLTTVRDEKTSAAIADAQRFLTNLQYDDHEKYTIDNPWYGGAGYTPTDRPKRPDLSNTQMMVEALHQSGLPPNDPAYQKALTFITRCQNLAATNDQKFAKDGSNDGGFIYSPANEGESKASEEVRETPRRELRSYGSMTYAGFKSMLYAGVDRKDPRVKAAYEWIRRNYTLDGNANMPAAQSKQGLYYYYHVFAKALKAWGEPTVTDPQGNVHNWRLELIRKLVSLQRDDGSWVNAADRWNEGDPNYVTALAILSLQEAIR
jgi:squalene-hopene/tetraprenyl-beta-curcumene cyclase